jgi:predicted Ser/Thr protein kinase
MRRIPHPHPEVLAMPVLLRCPNGHQWEAATGERESTTDWPPRCPVCGATPQAETETLPPRAPEAGASSEAATLAPAGPPALVADRPTIPGYEIVEELGRGGMGVVFKAHHTRLDRSVALKVLPAEAGRDPAFAERFSREARALAKLNHPHIVGIYDFGQAGEQSYFVMEYVDGSNLRQRMKAGRIDPQEALRIAGEVCDALQYAHEAGIVHRDIKPENVLLDRRGRVKIADFGIAKILTGKQTDYTLTGPMQVVGTWHYMAPEQLENPLGLDHRADIYSLGVLLYEMLTGQRPVGRFPMPSQVAGVDEGVDALVLRALEQEPGKRFQQVAEMQAALQDSAKSTVLWALPANTPSIARAKVDRTEIQPAQRPNPKQKRRGCLVTLAQGMLLFIGGVGLILAFAQPVVGLILIAIVTVMYLNTSGGPGVLFYAGRLTGSVIRKSTAWTTGLAVFALALSLVLWVFEGAADSASFSEEWLFGYKKGLGISLVGIFITLLLLMIVLGSSPRFAIFRSVAILIAGTGSLVLVLSSIHYASYMGRTMASGWPNYPVVFFAVFLLAIALSFLGAMQLRSLLRQPEEASAKQH